MEELPNLLQKLNKLKLKEEYKMGHKLFSRGMVINLRDYLIVKKLLKKIN